MRSDCTMIRYLLSVFLSLCAPPLLPAVLFFFPSFSIYLSSFLSHYSCNPPYRFLHYWPGVAHSAPIFTLVAERPRSARQPQTDVNKTATTHSTQCLPLVLPGFMQHTVSLAALPATCYLLVAC